jgi:hypothetical protein
MIKSLAEMRKLAKRLITKVEDLQANGPDKGEHLVYARKRFLGISRDCPVL